MTVPSNVLETRALNSYGAPGNSLDGKPPHINLTIINSDIKITDKF